MSSEPAVVGVAAGVPFVARPPLHDPVGAPLVVVLHLMDAPRTEVAMASALPMEKVAAWRVYLGLPMTGSRLPPGGVDEVMRLGYEDALMNLIAPVPEQAAAELPAAVGALRDELPVDGGPIGLVGGSAGGAAVLLALAEGPLPVFGAALVNAAVRATDVIAAGERVFGVSYRWTHAGRRVADRLDFVSRAREIASGDPQPDLLLVNGEDDDPAFPASADALYRALLPYYSSLDRVTKVRIPGLGHPLAEEPGLATTLP